MNNMVIVGTSDIDSVGTFTDIKYLKTTTNQVKIKNEYSIAGIRVVREIYIKDIE